MERKSVLEQKAKVKSHEGRPPSTSCDSKMISCAKRNPNCCDKVTEFLCSACLLCICCPLCIVWCCIKVPCKIGWRAAKHAKNWSCCASSEKKIYAAYSSFSDIDSDYLKEGSKSKMTHKTNCCKDKDLQQAGV
ncbi:hypothetical protein FNV43_RR21359 [Rhamnella rubrinervis]|uniref:Uncharacterized protein n=1 Tax=Rhamnella rubrinervis TaxID=2594499 RepID=A0A8K0GV06_9ROSA|nr:hypothetical protein FNV43_RR21359 [Rhamnella rubrinervis]